MVKYFLQWCWQTAKMYPYEKSKVLYYGPREDRMKLVKDESHNNTKSKKTNRTTKHIS